MATMLVVTVLCPWASNGSTQESGNRPDMTNIVDWDVKHQHKQSVFHG